MKIMIPSRRHLSAVRGHLVMLYYLVHCILVHVLFVFVSTLYSLYYIYL